MSDSAREEIVAVRRRVGGGLDTDGGDGGDSSGGCGFYGDFTKAKGVIRRRFKKAKKFLRRKINPGKRIKSCCCCFKQPRALESPAESVTSDPNDPNFTFEMLRNLVETNDFYSKFCNPHIVATSFSSDSS